MRRRVGVAAARGRRPARLHHAIGLQRAVPDLLEEGGVERAHLRPTIAVTTRTFSAGVSPVRIIRYRRCSTIPDTVCTMDVNAATGIT